MAPANETSVSPCTYSRLQRGRFHILSSANVSKAAFTNMATWGIVAP